MRNLISYGIACYKKNYRDVEDLGICGYIRQAGKKGRETASF